MPKPNKPPPPGNRGPDLMFGPSPRPQRPKPSTPPKPVEPQIFKEGQQLEAAMFSALVITLAVGCFGLGVLFGHFWK